MTIKLLQKITLFIIMLLAFQNLQAQRYKIITIAGTGALGYNGDSIKADTAWLNAPNGVAVDSLYNVYIADKGNNFIRKINQSTGYIKNVTGDSSHGWGYNGDTIQGNSIWADTAELRNPVGITLDGSGNLYIADFSNHRVRKLNLTTPRYIQTIAGSDSGYAGDGGSAYLAKLVHPNGVAVDSLGNVYIADIFSNCIREIDHNTGFIATITTINKPTDIALDGSGNLYIISNYASGTIKKIDTVGTNTTIATGIGYMSSIAVDASGNLYVAFVFPVAIKKINLSTGDITTIAGGGSLLPNAADGGLATNAKLFSPAGIAIDDSGNIYIADQDTTTGTGGNRIRKLLPLPKMAFTANGNDDTSICVQKGVPVTFANQVYSYSPIDSIQWYFPGGTPSNSPSDTTVTYNNLGQYTVTLIATNVNGSDTIKKTIVVEDTLLQVTLSGNPSFCAGSSETLTSQIIGGSNPINYTWSNVSSVVAQAIIYSSGTYKLTVTDNNQCQASDSIQVTVIPLPAVSIVGNDPCSGGKDTLTAQVAGTGTYSYLWGNGENSQSIAIDSSGTYQVTVTDSYGCDNTVSSVIDIDSTDACPPKFYSGFTPNGDGVNDKWIIEGIAAFKTNNVHIFNRWGVKVWNKNNYDNDKIVWDGKSNAGADLPDGTYFYKVKTDKKTYKGWVNIAR